MSKKESQLAQEWGRFVQAFWLELPLAVANRIGNGDKTTLRKAGWKVYDVFVSLTNEASNMVYAHPVMGALTGQMMEGTLRIQQMANAATPAFFGNVWPAVGLPTANEVAALRTEIATCIERLTKPSKRLSGKSIRKLRRSTRRAGTGSHSAVTDI